MQDIENKMVPVTLMLDQKRHRNLQAASRSTRLSMSELVRLSLDGLMEILGDAEQPSTEGLARILSAAAADTNPKPRPRGRRSIKAKGEEQ